MTEEKLGEFYRTMRLIRAVEERIGQFVEDGEVHCPCHLYIGQEAVAVGVCDALERGDSVWGTHRSHGHFLARGGSLNGLMAEVFGKSDGCSGGRGGSMHLFAKEPGLLATVPIVAATIPIAVGAAWASKLRGQSTLAVAFFGDGATEEGHFHESLNMAALHKLPVLFVCENNFYASHLELSQRRVVDNLNDFGSLYGIPGIRLDGNDVEAVQQASTQAAARARADEGPTLLECRTFRWRGHVGPRWDLDVGVQRKGDLEEWMTKCPLARTKSRLLELGVDEQTLAAIEESVRQEVDEAEDFARRSPLPDEAGLLDHVFYSDESKTGRQASSDFPRKVA